MLNIRLTSEAEQKLDYFAKELQITKTELLRPHIYQLIEDMEDYFCAKKALQKNETETVSFENIKKEFSYVDN